MKKLLFLLMMAAFVQIGNAQLNVTYISNYTYNLNLSDIWGYVAPDGTEYGLAGVNNGLSIISLADPENPVEVAFVPGPSSTWRDIKTWGEFAYVTNETSGGLEVVDLSDLPNSATATQLVDLGALGQLSSCHNIWMDENGVAYLTGCNLNDGGIIYLDCYTDQANPALLGNGPNIYSHDVFTRNDVMYTSDIYDGVFRIYDVSDKTNTTWLGSQATDFAFTHNAWLSDDNNFLFTTDELANAPIGSYDVSDPTDIQTLDLFKPLITLGDGVIPHNVHVWQDWIIVSYYTDGCIIIDGSNPSNLIEVGNFDTFIPPTTGFQGVWGAYPFLPSGLILLSDISNGMYILEPNYVRACWLEGFVTDSITTLPINNADVQIIASQLNTGTSDATGEYKTGLATAGTYDVVYSAAGYKTKTISVDLDNGILTMKDVELVPLASYAVSGQVVDAATGVGVPDAKVFMANTDFDLSVIADADGSFVLPSVFDGSYDVYAGKWGYHTTFLTQGVNGAPLTMIIEIDKGYLDEFVLDLGWTVEANAATGNWERGEPIGTGNNNLVNPEVDINNDLGDQCYMTGNGGGNVGNDDVDNGNTVLTCPSMDLTNYIDPVLSFYAWFHNSGGQNDPDDELTITVNNGITSALILTIDQTTNEWEGPLEYILSDFIEITDNMTVVFETADQANSGNLVEAAIDVFEIKGDLIPSATLDINKDYQVAVSPNPFNDVMTVNYVLPENINEAKLVVYNTLGQQILQKTITAGAGSVSVDDLVAKGVYLIQIEADGLASSPVKVMKAN